MIFTRVLTAVVCESPDIAVGTFPVVKCQDLLQRVGKMLLLLWILTAYMRITAFAVPITNCSLGRGRLAA
jgi:hypothetical protein